MEELRQKLVGKKVESLKYGTGHISDFIGIGDVVNQHDKCYGLMKGIKVTIQFDPFLKVNWFVNIGLDVGALIFDDETAKVIREYDVKLNPVQDQEENGNA